MTLASSRTAGAPRVAPSPLELALFSLALVASGLVLLALAWAGTGPYVDMARANGATTTVFVGANGAPLTLPLADVTAIHQSWSFYVTGGGDEPPTFANVPFTANEVSHMVDVRHVFDLVKLAIPTGLVVIIIRMQRARRRGSRAMWRLVRDGSLAALAIVAIVGTAAALAFEPMFMLFHEVFFPQGNFLFPPSSNLIRVYPDWYFEGMTLRIAASFVAGTVALALIAAVRLRGAK